MKYRDETEKRPKKRSGAGIVVMIIFLLLAGAVGYLYYSICKAPFLPDDPVKLAASGAMDPQERFRFSAADRTVEIKMDKADVWSLILAHTGTDFIDDINEELKSYDLEISGYAIHMDQDGLQLKLELYYQDTRLLASVPCELEISGEHICLKPTGVKLGVISLPVGKLLDSVKFEYDHALPVLTEVTQIRYDEGAALLTGPFEQDVRTLLPAGEELDQAVVFCKEFQPLVDALKNPTGFDTLLTYLEQDPGSMEDLYRELFTLAKASLTERYLKDRYGLTQRFFPGIDFDRLAQQQKELYDELNVQYITLKKFFTNAVNEYNPKRLHISDGVFIYEKEPFQAALFEYRKYGTVFEVLDSDAAFLIVVDAADGFTRKTPAFGELVAETQPFTKDVDFSKPYILGFVFRSVDADPYLMYETEGKNGDLYVREIKLLELTEDEVKALQEPGKIGVWAD